MLKNSKGILLDLDHTLYNYHKCHSRSLENVVQWVSNEFHLKRQEVTGAFEAAKKKINTDLATTASSHNRILYFQVMYELLDLQPLKYTLHTYNLYWDTFLSVMNYDEGVVSLLQKLSKEKKICLVTDLTAHIQHRKVEKLELHRYVHHMVSSEEAGREKPGPLMFEIALRKLGLKITEVCMIGDNFKKDILGALNMNIYCYWLNKDNETEAPNEMVTVIKEFKELENYA